MNILNTILISLALAATPTISTTYANNFLPSNSAFTPSIHKNVVAVAIQPNHYLYQDKFKVIDAQSGKNIPFKFISKPILKFFPEISEKKPVFESNALIHLSAKPNTKIKITYQGCSSLGLCYPPQNSHLIVK